MQHPNQPSVLQPSASQPLPARQRLHTMLRDLRQKADQTTQGMALLLNIDQAAYQALEQGQQQPNDDLLKRICLLAEWNYHQAKQTLFNENALGATPLPQAVAHVQHLTQHQNQIPPPSNPTATPNAGASPGVLGKRLREVRLQAQQTEEAMALLFNVDPNTYLALEQGDVPNDALLRRISLVCDWNYLDLLALLRSEQASTLQPKKAGHFMGHGEAARMRFRHLVDDIAQHLPDLPADAKTLLLTQVEWLRDTVKKTSQQHLSLSANPQPILHPPQTPKKHL